MRWEFFDFDEERPVIRLKSFEGFELKTYEERVIPMSRRIYEAFYSHRKEEGFVFESNRPSQGKYFYRFEPKKGLIAALKGAGLPTAKAFHRLRYSFASILVQKGVSIFKVSKWLGHASVRTTEQHYVSLQAYDSEIDSF